jgi:hypothetical protein
MKNLLSLREGGLCSPVFIVALSPQFAYAQKGLKGRQRFVSRLSNALLKGNGRFQHRLDSLEKEVNTWHKQTES